MTENRRARNSAWFTNDAKDRSLQTKLDNGADKFKVQAFFTRHSPGFRRPLQLSSPEINDCF